MKKRPLVFAACIFLAVIMMTRSAGVPSRVRVLQSSLNLDDGTQVVLTGMVLQKEEYDGGWKLLLTDLRLSDGRRFRSRKASVRITEESEDVAVGTWIRVRGEFRQNQPPTNPGQFNFVTYEEARGIMIDLGKGRVLSTGRRDRIYGLIGDLSDVLGESLSKILGDSDAGVMRAMLLGQRQEVPEEVRTMYQTGGIAHILAVSGLHINLIAMGLYRFLRRRHAGFRFSGLVSGTIVAGYCVMTGMSVSAKRSLIMFLIWVVGQIFGRTTDTLTSLAAAVFAVLLTSPDYIADGSFWLSFGCLGALSILYPPLEKLLPRPVRIHPSSFLGKAWELTCMGIAIQIGTIPIVCRFYYQFSPWSLLVNLLILPCLSWLLTAAAIGSCAALIMLPFGMFLGASCRYLLAGFRILCSLERQLPGCVIVTGCPRAWKIGIYYLLVGISVCFARKLRRRHCIRKRMLLLGMLISSVVLMTVNRMPAMRVTFADVGQGDGIIVEAEGAVFLVDCGSSSVTHVWRNRVQSILKYRGIDHIDGIFLSHGDEDHICGVREMLEDYQANRFGRNPGGMTVGCIYLPETAVSDAALEKIADLATDRGITVRMFGKGSVIRVKDVSLKCLYPDRTASELASNDRSMVLLVKRKQFSMLLTGDLEAEGEKQLDETGEILTDLRPVTVLKAAHHGSSNATSETLLRRISPKFTVISCGQNNIYGHPSPRTLLRLKRSDSKVLRTDEEGAITLYIGDESIRIVNGP